MTPPKELTKTEELLLTALAGVREPLKWLTINCKDLEAMPNELIEKIMRADDALLEILKEKR